MVRFFYLCCFSFLALGCTPEALEEFKPFTAERLSVSNKPHHFLVSEPSMARYAVSDMTRQIESFQRYKDFFESGEKDFSTRKCETLLHQREDSAQGKIWISLRLDQCEKGESSSEVVDVELSQDKEGRLIDVMISSRADVEVSRKKGSLWYGSGHVKMTRTKEIRWHLGKKGYKFQYWSHAPYIGEFKKGSTVIHETDSYIETSLSGVMAFLLSHHQVLLEEGRVAHFRDKDVYELDGGLRFQFNKHYLAQLVLSPQELIFEKKRKYFCLMSNEVVVEAFSLGQPFYPVRSRTKNKGAWTQPLFFQDSPAKVQKSLQLCRSNLKTLNNEIFFPGALRK